MTLSARDIRFAYRRGRPVFGGLTASFAPGRVTALLGPNASGKTTLVRLLLGLLRPSGGTVTLSERDVHSMPEPERARRMAYIPQRPAVAFGFSSVDVVAMGSRGRATPARTRTAALAALERLDLASAADTPFTELSIGQQQRAVWARALVQLESSDQDEAALIADEPTSAMDPRHALEAMALLREHAESGRTVVVVLQDLSAALRFADDALLLDAGGTVADQGPIEQSLSAENVQRVFGVDSVRMTDEQTGAEALITTAVHR